MENQITTFDVINDTEKGLIIVHEPECFEFVIPPSEEVKIGINSCRDSIALKCSIDNDGTMILSILGNKSHYRVLHKGVDVFEKYMD